MKPIRAPPLLGITWLNSSPIDVGDLKGKPVLIHFWTYCNNTCRRNIPALQRLWEHYKDHGLIIIGVHTPQFEFEGEMKHVEAAAKKLGVEWPIALDSEKQTWHAYHNHYWPRYYLICKEGNIVWDHIGDNGEYEMESAIRKYVDPSVERVFVNRRAREYGALTPKTYCGRMRNAGLGGSKDCKEGVCSFEYSDMKSPGVIYPEGKWEQTEDFLVSKEEGSGLVISYTAGEANIIGCGVMEVLLDGKPVPSEIRGDLIEKDGKTYLEAKYPDCYKVIKDHKSEVHELKVIAKEGARVYAFSFG